LLADARFGAADEDAARAVAAFFVVGLLTAMVLIGALRATRGAGDDGALRAGAFLAGLAAAVLTPTVRVTPVLAGAARFAGAAGFADVVRRFGAGASASAAAA
jgi:hypothetical protein